MSTQETRLKLDAYLDGDIASGPADAAEAKLLARMKSERALRAAAFQSYMPSAEESSRLAAQMMAAAHAPVGRVGTWSPLRRLVGIAAAIAVLAGTFAVGRMTASPSSNTATVAGAKTYLVVYSDRFEGHSYSEFSTEEEMKAFLATLEQNGTPALASGLIDRSESLAASEPGSI